MNATPETPAPGQALGHALHDALRKSAVAEFDMPLEAFDSWDNVRQSQRDRLDDAAKAVVARYIELNGADPVDARAVIADALKPEPLDAWKPASGTAAQPQAAPGDWWVCDGPLPAGGKKIIGPFATQELALSVRSYVEKIRGTDKLWVDDEPRPEQAASEITAAMAETRKVQDILAGILAGATKGGAGWNIRVGQVSLARAWAATREPVPGELRRFL